MGNILGIITRLWQLIEDLSENETMIVEYDPCYENSIEDELSDDESSTSTIIRKKQ
ncbi:unnamed protein product [Tenebrio molitor]|nr:unnamed protein product [Tenebrio molitor]